MSNSLQDQLLSLGVADKKKVKQARHKQRLEGQVREKRASVQESLAESQKKAREEKKARDKSLAVDRDAKRLHAERLAQVRDMVKSSSLDRGLVSTRVDFRFPYGKKIRPFPVSAEVRERLAKGQAGLLEIDGAILIIPRDVLQRCLDRLDGQAIFTHLAKLDIDDENSPPIPDDLDW